MTARITSSFYIENANSFVDKVKNNSVSLYVASGCPVPIDDDPQNDITPPDSSTSSEISKFEMYDQILNMFRIQANGVIRGTIRFDWIKGSVYEPYRQDIDVTELRKFYCSSSVGNEIHIYKCLYAPQNNNGVFLPSTIKPTLTEIEPFILSDGYVWKYMYTLTPSQISLFLTKSFMPVPSEVLPIDGLLAPSNSQREQLWKNRIGATFGSVHYISVDYSGQDIIDGIYDVIITNGTPTPPTQTILAKATVIDGQVKKVVLSRPGIGYSGICNAYLPSEAFIDGLSERPKLSVHVSAGEGHGTNPADEIGANYVLISGRFTINQTDDSSILHRNSFRRVGLVLDPIDTTTNQIAKGDYYSLVYKATLDIQIEGITENSIIYRSNVGGGNLVKKALVVDYTNSFPYTIWYIPLGADNSDGIVDHSEIPMIGEIYYTQSGLGQGTIKQIESPKIKKYSGKVIHIENRKPLNRYLKEVESHLFVLCF